MTRQNNPMTAEMISQEIANFRQQQKTLILATLSAAPSEHQPLASYAPFIEDEAGNFYNL